MSRAEKVRAFSGATIVMALVFDRWGWGGVAAVAFYVLAVAGVAAFFEERELPPRFLPCSSCGDPRGPCSAHTEAVKSGNASFSCSLKKSRFEPHEDVTDDQGEDQP